MATKQLKGVIVPRHDTAKNWAQAKSFVPRAGELIVYTADGWSIDYHESVTIGDKVCSVDSSQSTRFKIGNGVDNVNVLPFIVDSDGSLEKTVAVNAQLQEVAIPNGKTKISVGLRPTYNLYDFDNTVIKSASILNRIFTDELLNISDFTKITVNSGYQAFGYLYNADGILMADTRSVIPGGWIPAGGSIDFALIATTFPDAEYFRVVLAYSNDGNMSVPTNSNTAITCELDPSSDIVVQSINGTEFLQFNQGTIDKGTVYSDVTTRVYSNVIQCGKYKSVTIPSGYKAYFHRYDDVTDNGAWLEGIGWKTGTVNLSSIVGTSSEQGFRMVIGCSDDSAISDNGLAFMDLFKFETLIADSISLAHGTVNPSIVTKLICGTDSTKSVNTRNGVTLTNIGKGRVQLNGTVTGSNLELSTSLQSMFHTFTKAGTFVCSLHAKENGEGDSVLYPFQVMRASDVAANSYLEAATSYTFNTNTGTDIPGYIKFTAPVGTTFNNTVAYLQIESGTTIHEWEEVQQDTARVDIFTDMGSAVSIPDVATNAVATETVDVTNNFVGVVVTDGCRIASITYCSPTYMTHDEFTESVDLAVKTSICTNTNTLSETEKAAACNWLGTERIIVSYTEPSNPTEGTIWVMPI